MTINCLLNLQAVMSTLLVTLDGITGKVSIGLISLAHRLLLQSWKQFQGEGCHSCHEETLEQHQMHTFESINNQGSLVAYEWEYICNYNMSFQCHVFHAQLKNHKINLIFSCKIPFNTIKGFQGLDLKKLKFHVIKGFPCSLWNMSNKPHTYNTFS